MSRGDEKQRLLGVCRSFVLTVAHGLCSSGLFCLSNISYERFGRRWIFLGKVK
jgi:NADH-ubiquinone oxidoreductase chain 4